jgi:hypothetical protein
LSLLVVGALFYVGIDWAAATHAVCVVDDRGRRAAAFTIDHAADGFTTLIRRLGRLAQPGQVAIAIERHGFPSGLVMRIPR